MQYTCKGFQMRRCWRPWGRSVSPAKALISSASHSLTYIVQSQGLHIVTTICLVLFFCRYWKIYIIININILEIYNMILEYIIENIECEITLQNKH